MKEMAFLLQSTLLFIALFMAEEGWIMSTALMVMIMFVVGMIVIKTAKKL